jgi:predicted amidohydrolase YtcJ
VSANIDTSEENDESHAGIIKEEAGRATALGPRSGAYTRESTFAEHAELQRAILNPGQWPDVAVRCQDPLTVAPESLPSTRSALPLVVGKVGYENRAIQEIKSG